MEVLSGVRNRTFNSHNKELLTQILARITSTYPGDHPVSSAWPHVSTKDTHATKMRLSQQWLFPCLNRKEYCMPRTKDLPKTDKLMQKVYEILFSVYNFI